MIKGLNTQEIKVLKQEKRMGHTFAVLIISVGSIANFIFAYLSESPEKTEKALFVELLILLIGTSVSRIMNNNANKDLKYGRKIVKQEKVSRKIDDDFKLDDVFQNKIASGGIVLPKMNTKEFADSYNYRVIINKYVYIIDKELYDSIEEGEIVEMHFSEYSNALFDITKIK